MGFPKRLSGRRGSESGVSGDSADHACPDGRTGSGLAGLDVLLASLPDADALRGALNRWAHLLGGTVKFEPVATSLPPDGWSATGHAGLHVVVVNAVNSPLSPGEQHTAIHFSTWDAAVMAPLSGQAAHLHLTHVSDGVRPEWQLRVLYAGAAAWEPLDIADLTAFTCLPGGMLAQLVTPDALATMDSQRPTVVCTGLLKFHRSDGRIDSTTRGFEHFGKANLSWLAPARVGKEMLSLFGVLLNSHCWAGQRFGPGRAAGLGVIHARFSDPTGYADLLSGTLEFRMPATRHPH